MKNERKLFAFCLCVMLVSIGLSAIATRTITDSSDSVYSSIVTSAGGVYPATFTGLQAAIYSLNSSGGEVTLPNGNIDVTEVIKVCHDNITISGGGNTTIRHMFASGTKLYTYGLMNIYNCEDVTIRGVHFYGDMINKANTSHGIYVGSYTAGQAETKRILVTHCSFNNFNFSGLHGSSMNFSEFSYNTITDIGDITLTSKQVGYGIQISNTSSNNTISYNFIKRCREHGIKIYETYEDKRANTSTNDKIIGNTITQCALGVPAFAGLDTAEIEVIAAGALISENVIIMDSISRVAISCCGRNSTISDNRITQVGAAFGAAVVYILVSNGGYGTSANNTVVSGNIVIGTAITGYGIKLRGVSFCSVVGNVISDVYAPLQLTYDDTNPQDTEHNIIMGNIFKTGRISIYQRVNTNTHDNTFCYNDLSDLLVKFSYSGTTAYWFNYNNTVVGNNGYNNFRLPTAAPTAPIAGYMWENVTTGFLMYYSGAAGVTPALCHIHVNAS